MSIATGADGAGVVVEPVDVCEPPPPLLLGVEVAGGLGDGVGVTVGVDAVVLGAAGGVVAVEGAGAGAVFEGTLTFGIVPWPVVVPGTGVVLVEAGGVVAAGGAVVAAGGAWATCAAA